MSVADVAKSVIKSINNGDTLATVGLGASNFHEGTIKLATVLLGKNWVEYTLQLLGHHHTSLGN